MNSSYSILLSIQLHLADEQFYFGIIYSVQSNTVSHNKQCYKQENIIYYNIISRKICKLVVIEKTPHIEIQVPEVSQLVCLPNKLLA